MDNAKRYSKLMEKGDNLWRKSYEDNSKGPKRRTQAKRYYRQAEIVKIEAGTNKTTNTNIEISNSFNKSKKSDIKVSAFNNLKTTKKSKK